MDNESVHKSGQKKCTHKMDKKSVHTKMGTSDQIVIINRIIYFLGGRSNAHIVIYVGIFHVVC